MLLRGHWPHDELFFTPQARRGAAFYDKGIFGQSKIGGRRHYFLSKYDNARHFADYRLLRAHGAHGPHNTILISFYCHLMCSYWLVKSLYHALFSSVSYDIEMTTPTIVTCRASLASRAPCWLNFDKLFDASATPPELCCFCFTPGAERMVFSRARGHLLARHAAKWCFRSQGRCIAALASRAIALDERASL